uniref:5-oxoprolinase subunit B family protein n=1 Tax=Yoonia sp. TaxID=2212373 RepID=UPI0040481614
MKDLQDATWPKVKTAGFDGFLISFGDQLNEPANRAALAFRDALEQAGLAAVQETSTSLVSTYLRFDPLALDHATMRETLVALLKGRNWFDASLPRGRKLWRVPTVYGGDLAPQLEGAATAAGLTSAEAIASISSSRVRVQTIGFAPGMPYLGELPEAWNIPRQTSLNAQTPAGGLCVAIRQLVLFPVATPTGWRHIGQTAFRLFRPETDAPFVLRPGDEVMFEQTTPEALTQMQKDPDGGAVSEDIA